MFKEIIPFLFPPQFTKPLTFFNYSVPLLSSGLPRIKDRELEIHQAENIIKMCLPQWRYEQVNNRSREKKNTAVRGFTL